uniref:Uncharacterized protein n=1 Tax=Parastrongyloides trichosuri TaxID=131310 RepID=A0A0N4Z596_PARTI
MITDDIYAITSPKNGSRRNSKASIKRGNYSSNDVSNKKIREVLFSSNENIYLRRKRQDDIRDDVSVLEQFTNGQEINFPIRRNSSNNFNLNIKNLSTTTQKPLEDNELIFGRFKPWVLGCLSVFYCFLIIALFIICKIDLKVRNTTVAGRKKTTLHDGEKYSNAPTKPPPSLTPPRFHDEYDTKGRIPKKNPLTDPTQEDDGLNNTSIRGNNSKISKRLSRKSFDKTQEENNKNNQLSNSLCNKGIIIASENSDEVWNEIVKRTTSHEINFEENHNAIISALKNASYRSQTRINNNQSSEFELELDAYFKDRFGYLETDDSKTNLEQ